MKWVCTPWVCCLPGRRWTILAESFVAAVLFHPHAIADSTSCADIYAWTVRKFDRRQLVSNRCCCSKTSRPYWSTVADGGPKKYCYIESAAFRFPLGSHDFGQVTLVAVIENNAGQSVLQSALSVVTRRRSEGECGYVHYQILLAVRFDLTV